MEASSIVVFVVIAGFIWGGFLLVLTVAMRKEGAKTREAQRPDGAPPASGPPPME